MIKISNEAKVQQLKWSGCNLKVKRSAALSLLRLLYLANIFCIADEKIILVPDGEAEKISIGASTTRASPVQSYVLS